MTITWHSAYVECPVAPAAGPYPAAVIGHAKVDRLVAIATVSRLEPDTAYSKLCNCLLNVTSPHHLMFASLWSYNKNTMIYIFNFLNKRLCERWITQFFPYTLYKMYDDMYEITKTSNSEMVPLKTLDIFRLFRLLSHLRSSCVVTICMWAGYGWGGQNIHWWTPSPHVRKCPFPGHAEPDTYNVNTECCTLRKKWIVINNK